jgi:aminoacyl tRNA synthase complex-interacting multifunctional protein 1
MAAIDAAVEQLDSLIVSLEASLGDAAPPLRVDPDDPWAESINPPEGVHKLRCPVTGYLRTLPFEKNCPVAPAFTADSSWLDGLLKPVIKPAGGSAVAPPSKAPEAVGARAAAAKLAKAEKKAAATDAASGKADEKTAAAAPAAEGAAKAAPSDAEAAEAFSKAKLAVGKVVSAGFVEGSDKLYLCQVDVGEEKPRQVITGLRKYVAQERLQGAPCVVILNLKPAKLAGFESCAMILAAEVLTPGEGEGRTVHLVCPPSGAVPGERVHLQGGPPATAPPKECRTAPWATVKALLSVQAGVACFAGKPLWAGSVGEVTATAPDGSHIG